MSTWSIAYEQSSGLWANDTAIPRPNDDIETQYISTQVKIRLASGSDGYVIPQNKRATESFTMLFKNTTSAFRTQIQGYMYDGDTVRIITHTGEQFIGRFINMSRVWVVGTEPDEFDVTVTFELTG
jgi:hypothetical protein